MGTVAEGQLGAGRMGPPALHSLGTLVAPQGTQFLFGDFFFPPMTAFFRQDEAMLGAASVLPRASWRT